MKHSKIKRCTKKHKNSGNKKKTYRNKTYRKKIYRKKTKTYRKKNKTYKGGVKESDGFIIEIDTLNRPVENSLDFENAEIFLTNFIFNDGFIRKYLENDPKTLINFLNSPNANTIHLYSGDETQFSNLVDNLVEKNMNVFLRLYKLVEPESYEEFIKNLYKSKSTTTTPYNIEGRLIDTMAGGVRVGLTDADRDWQAPAAPAPVPAFADYPAALPLFPEARDDLQVKIVDTFKKLMNYGINVVVMGKNAVIDAVMHIAPGAVIDEDFEAMEAAAQAQAQIRAEAAQAAADARTRNRERLRVEAAVRAAAQAEEDERERLRALQAAAAQAEYGPLIPPLAAEIISHDWRRWVVTFNQNGNLNSFISKITTEGEYIKKYNYEANLYRQLRPRINPPGQLEQFYGWNRGNNVPIYAGSEIRVILDFGLDSGDRFNFKKAINLRHYTEPANLQGKYQINWGAMHGVYTKTHISFYDAITKSKYGIVGNENKIVNGLNKIFDNLLYFYTNAGFIHCDFKLDNMLVNLTPAGTDIDSALMFDLDFSAIVPGFFATTTRTILDRLPVRLNPAIPENGPHFNLYLKMPHPIVSVTAGFCHFFDCYFAAFSFIGNVSEPICSRIIARLDWRFMNANVPYSISIFKMCCQLIKMNPVYVGSGNWQGVEFNTIRQVILINRPTYNTLSVEQKNVIKWIWQQVYNCNGAGVLIPYLQTMLTWS
jgi:hypothetical protein